MIVIIVIYEHIVTIVTSYTYLKQLKRKAQMAIKCKIGGSKVFLYLFVDLLEDFETKLNMEPFSDFVGVLSTDGGSPSLCG